MYEKLLKKLTIFEIDFQTFFSLISEVEFITDYTVFETIEKNGVSKKTTRFSLVVVHTYILILMMNLEHKR